MKRNLFLFLLLSLLVSLFTYACLVRYEQRALAGQLIRLHVVAHSDRAEDQTLKLTLRDALLPLLMELTDGCRTKSDAEARLRVALPDLESKAADTLRAYGSALPVSVQLTDEPFPRRDYETFSLPAGTYTSLRITLGAGAGRNWWCVVFPSLCLPATSEELVAAAAESGLTGEQTDLISGETVNVELKFLLLDWLQSLFS